MYTKVLTTLKQYTQKILTALKLVLAQTLLYPN